jgi:hypothetical protein
MFKVFKGSTNEPAFSGQHELRFLKIPQTALGSQYSTGSIERQNVQ